LHFIFVHLLGVVMVIQYVVVLQKQLATLQASGSALAVEALQGILSQLKHLSDQISNDRKIP
jgi:hypothetical protein